METATEPAYIVCRPLGTVASRGNEEKFHCSDGVWCESPSYYFAVVRNNCVAHLTNREDEATHIVVRRYFQS